MNRAFLSLYLVIVMSVILVGWGADRIWQAYAPDDSVDPFASAFMALAEIQLQQSPETQWPALVDDWQRQTGLEMQLFSLEEMAASNLAMRIAAGELIALHDEHGHASYYLRLNRSDTVFRVDLAAPASQNAALYIGLLIAFYVTIALMIYIWVWPLARDLKKLQQQTQKIGADGGVEQVDLAAGSTVYPLAASFNRMAARIHELLAAYREMTYAVSHELRTPLARMKFALAMVESALEADRIDTEKLRTQVRGVLQDVADMDKLINALLAYASFEQQQTPLSMRCGDLSALVASVVQHLREAGADGDIAVHIDNALPSGEVQCEWHLLERCIHNVLQNALRYARSQVRVRLSVEAKSVQVAVEDDGPGIAAEDAEKIFQPFVRLRQDGDTQSGFGLGLAIVHRIMKWHQGSVTVSSSALGGACFLLQWPGVEVKIGK